MKLQKAVALRISQLLLKNKKTRYSFCKQASILEETLKRIIDEKNKDIKLITIAKLSVGFGISLSDLINFYLITSSIIPPPKHLLSK